MASPAMLTLTHRWSPAGNTGMGRGSGRSLGHDMHKYRAMLQKRKSGHDVYTVGGMRMQEWKGVRVAWTEQQTTIADTEKPHENLLSSLDTAKSKTEASKPKGRI